MPLRLPDSGFFISCRTKINEYEKAGSSGFAFFDGGKTGCLGNILWFLFGGLFLGLGWCVTGVLWRLTLIGILQCFKLAKLSLMPFGAEIIGG